jgi:hypothetical protein
VIRDAHRNIAPDGAKWELIARMHQLPTRHPSLRWAVLAASLAYSGASIYYFSIQVRQEARSRFETIAIGIANDVQSRIRAYGDGPDWLAAAQNRYGPRPT